MRPILTTTPWTCGRLSIDRGGGVGGSRGDLPAAYAISAGYYIAASAARRIIHVETDSPNLGIAGIAAPKLAQSYVGLAAAVSEVTVKTANNLRPTTTTDHAARIRQLAGA